MNDITNEEYSRARPKSGALFKQQEVVVPGGITHRSRHRNPFPLFIAHSAGAYKEDVDGHRYIDYWMGHGALLFGHAEPAAVRAVQNQAGRGFHAGGETELGLEWAELICSLVPSAEQVRFTSSGGEATQLAVRLARAATARSRIVKFQYNFHGWADQFTYGVESAHAAPVGVPPSVGTSTIVLPFNDLEAVDQCLRADRQVAAVILEPAGGSSDTVPVDPCFLEGVRALTEAHGVLLIFDEVVTGFRYAPGGAQEFFQVLPDITTLGKIVSGGLPAGAVAAGADVLAVLAKTTDTAKPFIAHSGTWNANPIAAAAGVATLKQLDARVIEDVTATAGALRKGLNAVMTKLGINGIAYGQSSIVKLHFGGQPGLTRGDFSSPETDAEVVMSGAPSFDAAFERAMVLEGVDCKGTTAFVSTAHGPEEVTATIAAFERALLRALEAVGEPQSLLAGGSIRD